MLMRERKRGMGEKINADKALYLSSYQKEKKKRS